jgi:uncharacterized membrane protein HdeD (DUF308 family)
METTIDRSIRNWWVILIRGILFIVLGIYMFCAPASSYAALGFILGLIIFLAGIVELLRVYNDVSHKNRGWHLCMGIIDILLGIILMGHIAASETILRLIIGIWFLFRGISLFTFAGVAHRSWLMGIGGLLVIILAIMILVNPAFGAMTIILWTGIAFIVAGLFNIFQAFFMKAVLR